MVLLVVGVLGAGGRVAGATAAEAARFRARDRPAPGQSLPRLPSAQQAQRRAGSLVARRACSQGGEQGPALVAGKPAESLLLERVQLAGNAAAGGEGHAAALRTLKSALLRDWIAAGAAWPKDRVLGIHEKPVDLDQARKFWSFQPVARPAVPSQSQSSRRAESPIRSTPSSGRGSKPPASTLSPPAGERGDLLRRLSLDLRGLPPTLDEQAAFPGRRVARRLRAARRSPARRSGLRRALGPALARPGALCRHQRLRARRRQAERLALSRLCDRGAQRRQAVRPLRPGADRRRRTAGRQRRDADRHRLSRPGRLAGRGRSARSGRSTGPTSWTTWSAPPRRRSSA